MISTLYFCIFYFPVVAAKTSISIDNINTSAPIDDHHSYNNNNKLHEVVECKNAECQIATQISALKIKIS